MQPSTDLIKTIIYLTTSFMPFHLFAYIPFWNHLRLPKKPTFCILIAEQALLLLPLFNSIIALLFTYPIEQCGLKALLARVLLMACMFLVYHFLVRSIQQSQKQAIAEEHSRSVEVLLKLQTEQYAITQQRIEEARRARHDLRYHWNVLQSYTDSGDFDALSAYIRKYGESMSWEAPNRYCDNAAVNAVLCFYAQKAAQQQIKMEISFPMKEEACIPEPELCVLLGNLLENALEACSACGQERYINVHAKQLGESSLILTVDNTGLEPVMKGDAFYSSKRPDFGLGTESVRAIARRYHGDARFKWKDGIFYASIMLNSNNGPM